MGQLALTAHPVGGGEAQGGLYRPEVHGPAHLEVVFPEVLALCFQRPRGALVQAAVHLQGLRNTDILPPFWQELSYSKGSWAQFLCNTWCQHLFPETAVDVEIC